LLVEAAFYLTTLLGGALERQLATANIVNLIVFLIGYATGITSLVYMILLIVFRGGYRGLAPESRPSARSGN